MCEYIQYFNVMFFIYFQDEDEKAAFSFLKERIRSGERFYMKDICGWLDNRGIVYCTRFLFRRDYPIKANIYNYYKYVRIRKCLT